MAHLRPIKGHNSVFRAPKGEEDRIQPAYVYKGRGTIVTAWEPSEEEMENIIRTGRIYVATWGTGMSPILLGDEDTIREATAESGILPRQE